MCQISQALPAVADTIQLGVEHSEYLPSVPVLHSRVAVPDHYHKDPLKAGAQQSSAATSLNAGAAQSATLQTAPLLPAQATIDQVRQATPPPRPIAPPPPAAAPTLAAPAIEWFPLPPGMAGVWSKRGDLTTSVTDLRTGMSQALNQWTDNELTVAWGHQTDKQGTVWHANLLPNERDSISSGKFVKFLVVGQKVVAYAPPSLVTRTHMVVSESYGQNAPATDVFQQEALNNMQVIGGILQVSNTTRVFTYHGQPVRDGALLSKFSRVANFQPTASLSGIDLVSSLRNYLNSSGRTDLAP